MKLAYFTDPIFDPIVHLNILLLLGVIDRLTSQRVAGDVYRINQRIKTITGKKYQDNNDDSDLYKISPSL